MCDNGPNICDSCQWVPGLTGNEGMHLFPFQILPPLTEQFLMGSRVAHKVGKPGCRQLSTDSIAVLATWDICSGNWHIARDRTGLLA